MDALRRLNRRSIRVTDLAAQYWCERQMELRYLYGEKMPEQAAKGKAMHEALERETNEPIDLEPKTYADYVYKVLYTDHVAIHELERNGKTREFMIFGLIRGFNVSGKIDQLEIRDGSTVVQEDKTRAKDEPPKESQVLSNKVQVMFYRKMLDSLRNGSYSVSSFSRFYGTDRLTISAEFDRQLDALGVEKRERSIKAMESLAFKSVRELPEIGDTLYLKYTNQFTGKLIKLYKFNYNEEELNGAEQYLFQYWEGEREAMPVPKNESWKCNYCVFFGNKCKAWWADRQQSLKA